MTTANSRDAALRDLDEASVSPEEGRPNLLGVPRPQLEHFVTAAGQKRFRATQVFEGLHSQRRTEFQSLTNLPLDLRTELANAFSLHRPIIHGVQHANDGTRKYQFRAHDHSIFEAVYIPEVARGSATNTLCVSSQTGCAVGCKFCFTASLRRNRNLSAAEVVGQVLAVRDDVLTLGESADVRNIVFMGMGEPLLNFENVTRAIQILMDPKGAAFPSRRITVSTSGIVPRIYDLGKIVPTQLAISLNATTDEIRSLVMPINKTWGLDKLIAALRAYPLAPRRQITVEYVLLNDVNDTDTDARRLIKLLEGIPSKVNLLPLNPHDRTRFSPPPWDRVLTFQRILKRAGINVLLRTPRGQEISAACGQLGESTTPP